MTEFVKGANVYEKKGPYGPFYTFGVNLEKFAENPINEKGYINFAMFYSQPAGKPYLVISPPRNSNKPQNTPDNKDENIMEFEDIDNVPF